MKKPKISLNSPLKYNTILSYLKDGDDYLVFCPAFDVPDYIKMVHHWLLVFLGEQRRWLIPVPNTWYMPHVATKTTHIDQWAKETAGELITMRVFE